MKQIEQINLIDYIHEINDKIIFPDSEEQDHVSEMKIHKILYIIYGNFYARFQKPLFKDAKFEAWQYGPVEIDFKNNNHPNDKFTIKLTSKQKDYVFKMIEKFLCFPLIH